MPKAAEVHEMTDDVLVEHIRTTRQDVFGLRFRNATGELAQPPESNESPSDSQERDDEVTDGVGDVGEPGMQQVAEDFSSGGDF